jgi:GNAT superfamily N-acetyltransferase
VGGTIRGIIMKKDVFSNIKEQLKNYKYSSLEYTEYEDISDYEVTCSNNQVILIFGYNLESEIYEFHWATNNVSILISELNKSKEKKVLITFIPTEWIEEFKKNKFDMYAIFNDYFNNDIYKSLEPLEAIEFLKECDCEEASEVTRSCRDQSRGFSGQSKEWLKEWIKGVEPNAVRSGGKDSAVLVHRENGNIAGIICVTIYGHHGDNGAVVWVREIAVSNEYQRRGIARKLLNQALFYGKSHGAKRGFLMADECNEHAIRLYESVGFVANKNEAENDMIRNLKD